MNSLQISSICDVTKFLNYQIQSSRLSPFTNAVPLHWKASLFFIKEGKLNYLFALTKTLVRNNELNEAFIQDLSMVIG